MGKSVKTFEDFVGKTNEEAEGSMYKPKLDSIAKNAMEIAKLLKDDQELEAWVQDKITIANHNMEAILSYMNTGKKPTEPQSKPLFSQA